MSQLFRWVRSRALNGGRSLARPRLTAPTTLCAGALFLLPGRGIIMGSKMAAASRVVQVSPSNRISWRKLWVHLGTVCSCRSVQDFWGLQVGTRILGAKLHQPVPVSLSGKEKERLSCKVDLIYPGIFNSAAVGVLASQLHRRPWQISCENGKPSGDFS